MAIVTRKVPRHRARLRFERSSNKMAVAALEPPRRWVAGGAAGRSFRLAVLAGPWNRPKKPRGSGVPEVDGHPAEAIRPMTDRSSPQHESLRIHRPCPKTWEELAGGDERRYCSECSLHVLNAALLAREEAMRLVREAPGRICMRVEHGADGRPVFRDEPAAPGRLARWTLSAAGLLAACSGAPATEPPSSSAGTPVPGAQAGTTGGEVLPSEPLEALGRVKLGDVALPPAEDPAPPEPLRLLGEVSIDPGPPASD
jgi:hypothetical protein